MSVSAQSTFYTITDTNKTQTITTYAATAEILKTQNTHF